MTFRKHLIKIVTLIILLIVNNPSFSPSGSRLQRGPTFFLQQNKAFLTRLSNNLLYWFVEPVDHPTSQISTNVSAVPKFRDVFCARNNQQIINKQSTKQYLLCRVTHGDASFVSMTSLWGVGVLKISSNSAQRSLLIQYPNTIK